MTAALCLLAGLVAVVLPLLGWWDDRRRRRAAVSGQDSKGHP
jgi:hypothetical protein